MDFNFCQYYPEIGRFLGVDPLADFGGHDRYSPYAAMGNMPKSMIDPDGLVKREHNPRGATGVSLDWALSGSTDGPVGGGGGALNGSVGSLSSLSGILKQFNYHSLGDFFQKSSADEAAREAKRKNESIKGQTSNANKNAEVKNNDAASETDIESTGERKSLNDPEPGGVGPEKKA